MFSPARGSNSDNSRRSKKQRSMGSVTSHGGGFRNKAQAENPFDIGTILEIPKKVVEVVQLDIVECYGTIDNGDL